MRFAAAVSRHPSPPDATAEVVGEVLEALPGPPPDLALLFCGAGHGRAFEDIVGTVRALVGPRRLLGVTAGGVIGGTEEVEDEPALSLWAAQLGYVPDPVRVTAFPQTTSGSAFQGLPQPAAGRRQTVLLLADPFTLPVPDMLDVVASRGAHAAPVIGGLASAGMSPGHNKLVLDGEIHRDGGVGVLLEDVETVVSQGCRPVGRPMIVTRAEGNLLFEVAGRPAVEQVETVLARLSEDERGIVADGGLHLGIVADEHQVSFDRDDFLVRNVVGVDRERGALAVGATPEVGTTVQFLLRDADSADEDLKALLAGR
ncbi:MAG TPA: FIST N-terminal domain-containing protein, partial [Acidimicrobiales bacterium]